MSAPSHSQRLLYAWLIFAFIVQVAFQVLGGTNARSRGASLVALVEEGTFCIDSYLDYTVDWSQTPDGHYYSNKAPGPVFLALPVFWLIDQAQTWAAPNREARDAIRRANINSNMRVLALLLQVLPFLILTWLWFQLLVEEQVSQSTRVLFLGALLFGNTASVLMNTFFGHGLASVFLLALLLALWRRQIAWAGFTFGWAVLCDYGAAVYALPLLWVLWQECRRSGLRRNLPLLALGAALPAVLWVSYHHTLFGGPLSLPYRYQNPVFVDKAAEAVQLWGVLGLPSPRILGELVFGTFRGTVWTQPWVWIVLVLAPVVFVKSAAPGLRWIIATVVGGFVLLLAMNASFGGWHGGASPGPRYLSIGLVLFAPLLALLADGFSVFAKRLAWASVVLSALTGLFILSAYEYPPDTSAVWPFLWANLVAGHTLTAATRLLVSVPVLLFLFAWRPRQ